ncbi:MAG: thiamine phosphate synthase [Campylobacteraceae bacterium]|jgi:thiamine-phosphate pyrophosphorylase|nr:thiamine phosphate synthase [Campylobacteraceae bacterium]
MKRYDKTLSWIIRRIQNMETAIVEYRNKTGNFEEKKDDILTIKEYLNVPVIVNDDISLVPFCEGVHLGQEDLLKYGENIYTAVNHVREMIGSKIFGISTHNEKEILEANKTSVDYIGLGAYRKTASKNTDNILGGKLSQLAALSKKPVAAIGGVKIDDDIANAAYLVVGSGLYEN